MENIVQMKTCFHQPGSQFIAAFFIKNSFFVVGNSKLCSYWLTPSLQLVGIAHFFFEWEENKKQPNIFSMGHFKKECAMEIE